MPRILVLIAEFYPYRNATANCIINICERLKAIDDRFLFDVLCFKTNADDPNESVYGVFNIKRVTKLSLLDKNSYFDYVQRSKELFVSKGFKKILFLLAKIGHKVFQRFSLKPWRSVYKSFYKRLFSLCRKNEYDNVIAVSGNYSVAYSAALFKHNDNHIMNLTIYLTDPLIGNPLFAHKSKQRIKKDFDFICNMSDRLVVTPVIYEELRDKTKSIPIEFPSFFEHEEYINSPKNVVFNKKTINFLYTGTFYPRIRDPWYLMELVKNLDDRYVLHICGTIGRHFYRKYRSFIEQGRLIIHNNLPQQELYNAICDCDFLVNIGNSTNSMLPSKLISYISSGKPIINIVKIKNCPTMEYLSNYSEHVNLFEYEPISFGLSSLKAFLSREHKRINKDIIFSTYRHCTTEFITSQFYNFVFTDNQTHRRFC